ncbi:UNVERIFIED_ORG: hypothetical protein ABIC62_006131 [Burkholderia sp. 1595]|uniref:Uncharacterized protein n=1 Tax=Paraburkholderia terricola TaxID=169427 RepID=A0ABU1M171_9BURK|nr:hypothetical protein [Paraburkholderia terricola]MDR6412771.1 hypothetical protein [Paraburkholderia terricola]
MTCVYSLHGEFLWPPTLDRDKQTGNPRRGSVEIHYDYWQNKTNDYRAFLRWRPAAFEDSTDVPEPADNVFTLGKDAAAAWFDARADQDVAIWMFRDGHVGGECLAFRGAFLFTQFEANPDDSKDPLIMRWRLLPSVSYAARSREVFSELIVGQPDKNQPNDNFRFNFHLPVPFEQTAIGAPNDPAVRALPFSVTFDPSVDEPSKALSYLTLVGGPVGTRIDDASFIFKVRGDVKTLGAFGFAAYDTQNEGYFVQYDDNVYDSPFDHVDARRYWAPLKSKQTAASCLEALNFMGFNVGTARDLMSKFRVDGAMPRGLSIRLPGPVPQSRAYDQDAWRLCYRLSFVPVDDDGDAGRISWRNNAFRFQLDEEIGGYLATGSKTLFLECEQRWTITREDVFDGKWQTRIALSLQWPETFAGDTLATPPTTSVGRPPRPVFSFGTLPAAAFAMQEAPKSLYGIEAAQPQSFLPVLTLAEKKPVNLALYAALLDLKYGDVGAGWPPPPASTTPTPLRLSIAQPVPLLDPRRQPNVLRLNAQLPAFCIGAALTTFPLKLKFCKDVIASDWTAVENDDHFFAWFAVDIDKSDSWQGRLSSLQFDSVGGPSSNLGLLKTGGFPGDVPTRQLTRPAGYPLPVAVRFEISLSFERITVLGPDIGRDADERATPLLIRLSPDAPASDNDRYTLGVKEEIAPFGDRLLTVTLAEDAAAQGGVDYVVLSEEPFALTRFTQMPLNARGNAENGVVAKYTSEDRAWQFSVVQDVYHYLLPPQSVGESADKPRRMELHDFLGDSGHPELDEPVLFNDPKIAAVTRPFRVFFADEKKNAIVDTSFQRRAVEFRLTPSAEIWIQPSDVKRGYFYPEWQHHDIFRQRGELGLGAALTALRAEFLYGMPVGVNVAKESGVARMARVAEIEALIGNVVPMASGKDKPVERWNALRPAILRRPERLEVWAQDPEAKVPFALARFSGGVSFALRQTALLRAPLPELEDPPIQDRARPVGEGRETFRYHPQGLSGGALWPVESTNLFKALALNPQSGGGTLDCVALSPIGGDAAQTATFLGGKVNIISKTRNGFIESQRVEVIGRIGALWHRAKHVVVYERTANPSAQFAPEYKEDPERTRSRRPILRKVREFIEILEHERAYPDFPQATARSCGFLKRVRFNSRMINVDSAWGRDVGNFGWEIPLWNRVAARKRPQVYPRPDVAFCSHSEGEGDTPTVAQECEDGDYLYFFADFKTPGDDTNAWPARLSIDYVNVPATRDIAATADSESMKDPDETASGSARRRRPVSRFLPGMRRFTWRLAPATGKVAVNAGRAGPPIFVGLHSVTFMRAGIAPGAGENFARGLQPALEASGRAQSLADALAKLGDPGKLPSYWPADAKNQAEWKQAFSRHMDTLRQSAADPDARRLAMAALQDWWGKANVSKALIDEFATTLNTIKANATGFAPLDDLLSAAPSNCEQMKSSALGVIRGKAMLVEALINDWSPDVSKLSAAVGKKDLINAIAKQIIAAIRPAFDEAVTTVANARTGVEKAHAILSDLSAQLETAYADTKVRIDTCRASYDSSKPWSDARLQSLCEALLSAAESLSGALTGCIAEARQRLAIELDDLTQQMAGIVASVLSKYDAEQRGILAAVADFKATVSVFLQRAREVLTEVSTDSGVKELQSLRDRINQVPISTEQKDALLGLLDPAKTAAEALRETAVQANVRLSAVEKLTSEEALAVEAGIKDIGTLLDEWFRQGQEQTKQLAALSAKAAELAQNDIVKDLNALNASLETWIDKAKHAAAGCLAVVGKLADELIKTFQHQATQALASLKEGLTEATSTADQVAGDIDTAMQAAQNALAPGALLDSVISSKVIDPTLQRLLRPLPESFSTLPEKALRSALATLSADVSDTMKSLTADAIDVVGQLDQLCHSMFDAADSAGQYVRALAVGAEKFIEEQLEPYQKLLDNANAQAADFLAASFDLDQSVRGLQNDLARSVEGVQAYGDRVLDAVGKLGSGGVMAAPGNILRLYSAVSSAPDLAALQTDIDRLRTSFDELSDVIGVTRTTAQFNRLGDELKALGLSFPFEGIGDRLLPADLSSLDIGLVFRNLGGAKLDSLFKGYKLPRGVADAIVVTHEFNPKQGRAWVQIDINVPMPGRRSLFSLEVFKADFVDMAITAQVRFEASDKNAEVTQTGFGRIETAVDLAVSGQSMVRFEHFALNFTRESGMKVEFDPQNIRINPSLQFIQDYLSFIFPDDIGGMHVIKRDGIPVGLEHEFAMPPVSLNFGTSGISNIAISNDFQLIAYPDFVLANQFWLSRPEQPFIFSFFIIGGTGYVHIDATYRPFNGELTVSVEAAAGGSAAIAFAFGPFSGQVFITLSVALNYQRRIGPGGGGGLSIGAVLVIAGYVNVASIATVGMYLLLRMTYRDNGQVDADGTLSVTIRISEFFKFTARANVKYRLRDGHAETQTSTSTSDSAKTPTEADIAKSVKRLQTARA